MTAISHSLLFQKAGAVLTDAERTQLAAALAHFVRPDLNKVDRVNERGEHVRRHIENEQQHSDDPTGAHPEKYGLFLRDLIAVDLGSQPLNATITAYLATCKKHRLQGLPIKIRPGSYLRYFSAYGFLCRVVDAMQAHLPNLAATFQQLVAEARRDGSWREALAFIQDRRKWDLLPRAEIYLAGPDAHSVFLTFETAGAPALPRNSSTVLRSALALWLDRFPKPAPLIEVTLDSTKLPSLPRFPTVCDAGWFSFFQCAKPDDEHGWTLPHDARHVRQPEAVVEPITLEHVSCPTALRVLDS